MEIVSIQPVTGIYACFEQEGGKYDFEECDYVIFYKDGSLDSVEYLNATYTNTLMCCEDSLLHEFQNDPMSKGGLEGLSNFKGFFKAKEEGLQDSLNSLAKIQRKEYFGCDF